MFKEDLRLKVEAKAKEGDEDINVDEELSRAWEELPSEEKTEWHTKWTKTFGAENDKAETQDEDVEMANDDEAEQAEKDDKDEKTAAE